MYISKHKTAFTPERDNSIYKRRGAMGNRQQHQSHQTDEDGEGGVDSREGYYGVGKELRI